MLSRDGRSETQQIPFLLARCLWKGPSRAGSRSCPPGRQLETTWHRSEPVKCLKTGDSCILLRSGRLCAEPNCQSPKLREANSMPHSQESTEIPKYPNWPPPRCHQPLKRTPTYAPSNTSGSYTKDSAAQSNCVGWSALGSCAAGAVPSLKRPSLE
jgi:hypothetical protein